MRLTEKLGTYSTSVMVKLDVSLIMPECFAKTTLPFGNLTFIGTISLYE
jgi:hypothetical protein